MPSNPSSTAPRSLAPLPARLPDGICAVFVIHAAKFVERRRSIESQLKHAGLPFEFVLDYDIENIPTGLRQQMFSNGDLSPAQQSCALKHWQVMQHVVCHNLTRALILEDDVILAPQFRHDLERAVLEDLAICGPHVTFLGCGGHYYVAHDEIIAGQLLYPRNQGKFGDSYIVSFDAAKRRVDWIATHGIAQPVDHLFECIDREEGTAMYWLEPPIVEQGSHNGNFSSTLKRSHPLWVQSLQFRWKKFWRRRRH